MKKFILLIIIFFLFTAQDNSNYIKILENKIFALINEQRKAHSLSPLKLNKKLSEIAKAHSADMAKRNYISHITPEGLDPNARTEKFGFSIIKKKKNIIRKGVGENIYETQAIIKTNEKVKYYLEKTSVVAQKAVSSWMNSEGHRKNILNPDYTITGIGIAISKDKKIKITQLFF